MKKTVLVLGIVVLLIIAGVGIFFYTMTQAPEAPSQSVNQVDMVQDEQSQGDQSYTISSGSSARFEIDEILRDQSFTAVGTTSEVGGTVDYRDGMLTLGTIRINARTFKTDNDRRDGAIANLILRSGEAANEFVVFTPTNIEKTGDMTYRVTGDMTVSGTTRSQVMTVTLTSVTDIEIKGTAEGSLKRSEYGLVIPSLPFIASVEDEFVIKADIIATK